MSSLMAPYYFRISKGVVMSKKQSIVKGANALQIQYEARGFKQTFHALIDETRNSHFSDYGDSLSAIATNGCFALELYFKFLIVLADYNEEKDLGKHNYEHTFLRLYTELSKVDQTYINDLEELYQKTNHKHEYDTLIDFLKSINDYFQQWRYSYDSGELRLNLNALADVLNIMDAYSTDKWVEKTSKLGHSEIPSDNEAIIFSCNQSLKIDDFDSLKENNS